MQYKLSYYNIVADETRDTVTVWNTKRGSVVELERPVWELLGRGDYADARVAALLDGLRKQGIVVSADLDEYEEIVYNAKMRQYATGQDSIGLVIAPTMACNYHCPYCFEHGAKGQKDVMSPEVADGIVAAVEKKLSAAPHVKNVRITWFGGEPLLAYGQAIVPLQEKLHALCSRMNVAFRAGIITNGYFLSKEKFDFLFRDHNTNFAQVTFDGTEREYCARKGTTPEAYRRAVGNILDLSEYIARNGLKVTINLRLNVDNSNLGDIKEFVRSLKADGRFHDNVMFSLERLRSYDFCKDTNDYCTTPEYEEILSDFEEFIGKPPKVREPKKTFCGQHCMNVFCVGVHGELYKCEHDFGVEAHAVGSIFSGLNYNDYFRRFMDQPLPEKCTTCTILPVCMGGCPHRRLELDQAIECEDTLEHLKKAVRKYMEKRRGAQ